MNPLSIITLQALPSVTQQQQIQRMIAQYQIAVAIAIVATLAAVAIGLCWFIWETWFTPTESKEIRTASRKKRPLVMLGGDDGFARLINAPFSGPEGILETKSVGKTGEHYTGALPRPREFEASEIRLSDQAKDAKPFDVKKTVAVANFISMLANRRLLLRGARVPVWFAYSGKAILTSLYGLVALQILEGMKELKELEVPLSVIDIVAIKALFSEQWNESQLNAQESDKERKGELKAKRFAGKESLVLVFVIMIVFIVALILLIAAVYFFKGGNI